MTDMKRTWQHNADEARATEAGTGWFIVFLVVCSVRQGKGGRPRSANPDIEGQVFATISGFAKRAGLAENRITSILRAYPEAVEAGLVPPMDDDLTPDRVGTIPIPTVPFGDIYRKYTPDNDRYRLESALRQATPEQIVAAVPEATLPKVVEEVARTLPKAVSDPMSRNPGVLRDAVRTSDSAGQNAAYAGWREANAEQINRLAEGHRKSEEEHKERKAKAHSIRWNQVSALIGKARVALREALDESHGVEFTADEREDLENYLNRLQAMTDLLRASIVGTSGVDWDAELAKMGD